ncbi:MAG: HAMP domain-containing histidine kinase [Bacteroidia bacterium]|nr:HAMP domain-containing histidine kinase [Bacteroidia bacterium]
MKLLNRSILHLSGLLLFIVGLMAVIFYINMLDEIRDSVDKGLDNYKHQIIVKAQTDSSLLRINNFEEGFFSFHEIPGPRKFKMKDRYTDTLMYMQETGDRKRELEPVRMLSTVFESQGKYYELRIINSMVEEDELIEGLLWEAFWFYVVLIAGIIVINNFVLQRLWKPFYSFLNQLKKFRLGNTGDFPQVKTNTNEFNDLQSAVNTLLEHSTETFERQKQFIGNASHELQTPLAIALTKLELFIEKGGMDKMQAEELAGIMHIIERMIRLNKSLLMLTKIENRQFSGSEEVSITGVLHQCVAELREAASHKKVAIHVEENGKLPVQMDPVLANIIISNLLRNAVFHNIPEGTVMIHAGKNSITICNTAKGDALPEDKVFTRFYKPGNESTGTGLGLAIVKAICNMYNFVVSYRFENFQHCFKIEFSNS